MNIAFASSEVVPFAKTGGLADVSGSLPIELAKLGHSVKVFMPKYYSVDEKKYNLEYLYSIGEMRIRVDGYPHAVHVSKGKLPKSEVEIYFIDAPYFFHRHQIYTNDLDEADRFILFSKSAIELIQRLGWRPDIFHCNDWQTGLIPLLLKENYSWDRMFDKTATVLTIHNIGYQGRFSKDTVGKAELGPHHFYPGGPIEYEDGINFLKAGIMFADVINTVSETYAKELLTPEYGHGMQSFLAQRKDVLFGILNGVDYNLWDPSTDRHIPHHYNPNDLTGKLKNKHFLLERLKMPYIKNVPVIGLISRLVPQKGFDIIADALNDLIKLNAQWVVLGSGNYEYEQLFNYMAAHHREKFSVYLGFNDELAHLIEAGSDIFLMPSKYEPCGLNQIYSLKYGTVPVVRKTGGLADTVHDWNEFNSYGMDSGNGFSFYDYNSFALLSSVQRALGDYHNIPVWKKIQQNGMSRDFSWKSSAEKYAGLYQIAVLKSKF